MYIPLSMAVGPRFLIPFGIFAKVAIYFVIITVWGFFEGFTYVVISDKINKIFKPKNLFLNAGAILCAIFVVVIHLLVGDCQVSLDIVTTFIIIYGMLIIRNYTQNSLGCIFLFIFFWNAF